MVLPERIEVRNGNGGRVNEPLFAILNDWSAQEWTDLIKCVLGKVDGQYGDGGV